MSNSKAYRVSRRQILAVLAAGMTLIVVNLFLVQQNKSLKAYSAASDRKLEAQVGTMLGPIHGTDVNGEKISFSYGQDHRKTLLMVFSPKCGPCKENMPYWQSLVPRIDPRLFRVVGVSMVSDGVRQMLGDYDLKSTPVIADVDPRDRVAYSLSLTPQMLIIDERGAVEKVWTGVIHGDRQSDIETSLALR